MKQEKFSFKKIFSSRGFSIIALAGLFFSLFFLAKGLVRHYKISREISGMEREAESLERDNVRLAQFIKYSSSDSSREKEARLRLELQKEGERAVVIYPPDGLPAAAEEEASDSKADFGKENGNFLKWRDYFFSR